MDPNLFVMAKVSPLIDGLLPAGNYELVNQPKAQFILSTGRMNMDVTWSSYEVSFGVLLVAYCVRLISILLFVLVYHPERKASSDSVTWCLLVQFAWRQWCRV